MKFDKSPLHEQVSAKLRQHIERNLQPGQKLDAETTLAKQFGVAVSTIREAMTTFAHEGLVERRPGRGTIVCDRQARQHVALIMGIHPTHARMGYYHFRLMEFMHQFFAERGLTPRLYWARESSRTGSLAEFTRAVAHGEVAGVVVLKGPLDAPWWTAMDSANVPVVGGDRHVTKYRVGVDDREFLAEAVRYLKAQGRHRIGLIAWTSEPNPSVLRIDWAAEFRDAMRQHGCGVQDEWVRCDLCPVDPGAGYALFRETWMAHPEKPDGLVVCDEVFFVDIATAILEMRVRVPEHLLIVTHANKGSGTLYPFPTVRLEYDPDVTGAILGEQLLRLLRNESVPEGNINLPFRWVGAGNVVQPSADRVVAPQRTN